MAKFKPARRGRRPSTRPAAAVPCVIMIIAGIALVMLFLYLVMKYSGQ